MSWKTYFFETADAKGSPVDSNEGGLGNRRPALSRARLTSPKSSTESTSSVFFSRMETSASLLAPSAMSASRAELAL